MIVLLFLACSSSPAVGVRTPGSTSPAGDASAPADSAAPLVDSADGDTSIAPDTDDPPVSDTGGPCPAHMVAIEDFCIDAYEAHLVGQSPYEVPDDGIAAAAPGAIAQGYISGEVAQLACEAAGKRLCAADEWMRACQGPDDWTYPYGDTYDAAACNTTRDEHPILELFGPSASWSTTEMNDPAINQLDDTVHPSGSDPGCVTPEGVHDLHGNLHEWVDDPNGTFKGGFYVDAMINGYGCTYTTTAHSFDYHDYSTGFRCCADPVRASVTRADPI